ncbi:MAG: bifunctional nuclease family protein [Planctomycetota bacterium]|nr:bifunctional nuclease family protein [Planctomycetota bacterium]
MAVETRLTRIIISELTENQVIYLKEVNGHREFPILIGIFEATNIDRRVSEGFENPRPLTHDLIVSVAESFGARVDRLQISQYENGTYFAKLILQSADGQVTEIDARPSDAIAVAVTFSPALPIFVEEDVLEASTTD